MGHQMDIPGPGSVGIYFTDGANQIVDWCTRFTPSLDYYGTGEIPLEAISAALDGIPPLYDHALEQGLISKCRRSGAPLDKDEFDACRRFLIHAEQSRFPIRGSW